MKKNYTQLLFLTILYLLTACDNGNAQKSSSAFSMQEKIIQFTKEKGMKNASVGFLLIDVKTGKEIAAFNPDMSLSPASTMKLFSTATALELFGEDHRFETKIQYDGEIKNGILYGNIYIKGGGDPTLGSSRFEQNYKNPFFLSEWAEKIKALGINKIEGAIVGDAQYFSTNIIPNLRAWEDIANYYGAGACGLSIYDDFFEITFKSGANAGDTTYITEIKPEIPFLKLTNYVKASDSKADEAFVFGAPYVYEREIRGTIPKASSNFTIKAALPDPAHFAALELERYLKTIGVTISKSATTIRKMNLEKSLVYTKRKEIYTTFSPKLSEIVYTTNKISFNLYPEHLLTHIGIKLLNMNDSESGAGALKMFWQKKGMDTEGMFIRDGSGLTRYNFVTSRQLVFLLQYIKNTGKYYTAFNNSLPVAGKSGTLRNMCKKSVAEDNVRAKSGSISKVRAYSGYATAASGQEMAFAIMVNNYTCKDTEMRDLLEKILINIAETSFE
jgi:D-alanyl-D-alanine carboxypeptidase/D-alanyl-D-alanine-endopeptidase (penicillin-binding protein 4)